MRSFVSVGMFVFIAILFLSGLIMEVGEEVLETVYEDRAKIPIVFLFVMSFATATHVLSGIFFALLSIFHISKNWNALKNHIKSKSGKISKESILAFTCIAVVLILSLAITCIKEL